MVQKVALADEDPARICDLSDGSEHKTILSKFLEFPLGFRADPDDPHSDH